MLGIISFYGDDDAQDNIEFACIEASVSDASNGQEGGKLQFKVATHDGERQPGLVLQDGSAEDEVDVSIASGTSSVTTVAGDLTVTGSFDLDAISPTTFTLNNDRFTVEGASADNFETLVVFQEPTADRTITFKNESGTIAFTADLGFANSTLTQLPTAEGNADLAGGETPFDTTAADAFGFALSSNLYDMNEPKGTTSTQDLGQSSGI